MLACAKELAVECWSSFDDDDEDEDGEERRPTMAIREASDTSRSAVADSLKAVPFAVVLASKRSSEAWLAVAGDVDKTVDLELLFADSFV